MKEIFNLYLNSKQSIEGASVATDSLTFDLGSAVQNMPHLSQHANLGYCYICLLYTSPSPRDRTRSRMPSSA